MKTGMMPPNNSNPIHIPLQAILISAQNGSSRRCFGTSLLELRVSLRHPNSTIQSIEWNEQQYSHIYREGQSRSDTALGAK